MPACTCTSRARATLTHYKHHRLWLGPRTSGIRRGGFEVGVKPPAAIRRWLKGMDASAPCKLRIALSFRRASCGSPCKVITISRVRDAIKKTYQRRPTGMRSSTLEGRKDNNIFMNAIHPVLFSQQGKLTIDCPSCYERYYLVFTQHFSRST